MSHDIAKLDGRDAFAYAGERPWHGLGIQVPGLMTTAQAIVAGGLDWEVKKVPLMLNDITMQVVHGHYATVRFGPETNEDGDLRRIPLGIVGERYTVVQNREAFGFFDAALGEGAAAIETVGALGNGERIFAMARIPGDFEITAGDPLERYILLHTSHDGTTPLEALFSIVRVVCNNTLQAALRGAKQTVRIRHTQSVTDRVKQAHKVLCDSDAYWTRIQDAYKAMALRDMSALDVITFLENLFPGKLTKDKDTDKMVETVSGKARNAREKVLNLFEGHAKGSEEAGTSAWGLYNAVTEYVDHERSIRSTTDPWESSTFGTGADLRQKAFKLLTAGIN